ncbi:hypothetical protein PPS11_22244 [Pseudomonas putida S11]|nr:hypothetical protein PPS11_22244 [Pseudomonas putida S11]
MREQFGHQAPQGPLAVVLETADQRVHRKAEMPQCKHLLEGRCAALALSASQAGHRQWQGAAQAMIAQPGQFLLAGDTQRIGLLGRFIAQ